MISSYDFKSFLLKMFNYTSLTSYKKLDLTLQIHHELRRILISCLQLHATKNKKIVIQT